MLLCRPWLEQMASLWRLLLWLLVWGMLMNSAWSLPLTACNAWLMLRMHGVWHLAGKLALLRHVTKTTSPDLPEAGCTCSATVGEARQPLQVVLQAR